MNRTMLIFLLGAGFIIGSPKISSAQKLGDKAIIINYIRLPYFQLPEHIRSYKMEVSTNKFVHDFFSKLNLKKKLIKQYEKAIILDGFELLTDTVNSPGLQIKVHLKTTRPFRARFKSDVRDYVEERDGEKINKSSTHYFVDIEYGKALINLKMETKQGIFFEREIKVPLFNLSFGKNDNYLSLKSLETAWAQNRESKLTKVAARVFDSLQSEISALVGEYCLRKTSHNLKIEQVIESKNRTNHTYEDLNQAISLLEEGLGMFKLDSIIPINKFVQPKYEESTKKIQQSIEIWEKALKEADYEEDKARINKKIARSILFNLAKAYIWIEDFPKAWEYIHKRRESGGLTKKLRKQLLIFERFLTSQEYRYSQNSWRNVYTSLEELGKAVTSHSKAISRPRGITDTTINYASPASIHIYCDGESLSEDQFTILLNNQSINAVIYPGETLIYEVYSQGFLRLSLVQVDDDGFIFQGENFLPDLLELAELSQREFLSKKIPLSKQNLTDKTNSTFNGVYSPISELVSDLSYLKTNKSEIFLDIQPGAKYFIRISAIDRALRQKSEFEGMKEFYKRDIESVEIEEDVYNPIPCLSIFNALEQGIKFSIDNGLVKSQGNDK